MKMINVQKAASTGIAVGKVLLFTQKELKADTNRISLDMTKNEVQRYISAEKEVKQKLAVKAETSEIFAMHLDLVDDPVLHNSVLRKIQNENKNAELALEETATQIQKEFESLTDDFFQERAVDVHDVCFKLMCSLKGVNENPLSNIKEQTVLISNQLTPSDTADINLQYITGFVTQTGGENSHVAIMARSRGIPAIVGVNSILDKVKNGDKVIVDAISGKIIINPDAETAEIYNLKLKKYKNEKELLKKYINVPAESMDKKRVQLLSNAGSIEDVKNAVLNGAEGIGLFRTEFIYMNSSHFPSEDEQFKIYSEAAELCKGPLVIRTLDIGGDKPLSYFKFDKEDNPFLGMRAIRVCLKRKDIFKTQLRAILRASTFGNIQIMYPMIISFEELKEADNLLFECKKELAKQHIEFDDNIKTGMMVETPSAVVCIDEFAKKVDFFSIGTNDLTQYLLAVDRGNENIAELYNPFHPSVLRCIKKIIDAGHKNNIPVGMCGEFAGNQNAIPILLGLNLDKFSMAAAKITQAKSIICNTNYSNCKDLAYKVCNCISYEEINSLIENWKGNV